MQGAVAAPASILMLQGIEDTLKSHPEIKVVSSQAADWDATKAHNIAATILKQHPDLCAFVGNWDNSDVGIAAAVKEAGLQGKVAVVTLGGGAQAAGCDNIANGNFTAYVKFDIRRMSADLNDAIKIMLQNKPKPGSAPFALYTPQELITKDNLRPDTCWTLADIKGE